MTVDARMQVVTGLQEGPDFTGHAVEKVVRCSNAECGKLLRWDDTRDAWVEAEA